MLVYQRVTIGKAIGKAIGRWLVTLWYSEVE